MNKILLTLSILGAGAGGFFTARHAMTRFQQEAESARSAWLVQTQILTNAHSDQAELIERIRELRQALKHPQPAPENSLWFAVQTNGAAPLALELREQLLEELGFNWRSSKDYIVVSKETLREIGIKAVPTGAFPGRVGNEDSKVTDNVAVVLALTVEERAQVEAALQRVQSDFKNWASLRLQRSEPKEDVVAQYTLPADPAMLQNLSNNLVTGLFAAVGRERAELILRYARIWLWETTGLSESEKPTTMIVKRHWVGNELRLKVEIQDSNGSSIGKLPKLKFPRPFRPLFPNGWADVAEREGFELPKEPQK